VPESLNGRVHSCWLKPEPANPDEGPAATTARSPAAR
jgi:hypothetical protein